MPNNQPIPSFDGFSAIATHIEQRYQLENYINGNSKQPPDPCLTSCNADCPLAQWLHRQECKSFKDIGLLNRICNACEVFQSSASQAVLLMNMDKVELAKEVLQSEGTYSEASARIQRELLQLHHQLNAAW